MSWGVMGWEKGGWGGGDYGQGTGRKTLKGKVHEKGHGANCMSRGSSGNLESNLHQVLILTLDILFSTKNTWGKWAWDIPCHY